MASHFPSFVLYTLRGAAVDEPEPVRSRNSPVNSCHAASAPIIEKIGSSSERSMTCPHPPFSSISLKAVMTANAPCIPAIMSAIASGGRTGSLSAKPFRYANPDIASTSVPNPGRSLYGPVCPKPVIRTMIRFGLYSCNTSGPSPMASRVPGRKFSMNTWEVFERSSSSSFPRFFLKLRLKLFLFRPYTFHVIGTPLGSQWRSGSPALCGSTLMTSAPKSASWRLKWFPATRRDRSSTLTPSNGPDSSSLY